jgi:hypothetical protein
MKFAIYLLSSIIIWVVAFAFLFGCTTCEPMSVGSTNAPGYSVEVDQPNKLWISVNGEETDAITDCLNCAVQAGTEWCQKHEYSMFHMQVESTDVGTMQTIFREPPTIRCEALIGTHPVYCREIPGKDIEVSIPFVRTIGYCEGRYK